MPGETTFLSVIDESLIVRFYGTALNDLTLAMQENSIFASEFGAVPLTFVRVKGIRFLGVCHSLTEPLIFVLPGNGVAPTGCCEFKDQLMWVVKKGDPLASLGLKVATAEEFATPQATTRVDVDSNFTLSNVRLDGNTVKGHLRAYLRLSQSTPFGTLHATIIDRNDDFAFPIPDICFTIFSIGVASAQVCVRENPRRLCGDVSVGVSVFGIDFSKSFDIACFNF
jgi:hypothetical protein